MSTIKRVSISLPEEVLREADQIAYEEQRPRSQVIAEAVGLYVATREAQVLAEGYREMAGISQETAEAMLETALEVWAEWEGSRP